MQISNQLAKDISYTKDILPYYLLITKYKENVITFQYKKNGGLLNTLVVRGYFQFRNCFPRVPFSENS